MPAPRQCLFTAGVVVVFKNYNIAAGERLDAFVGPFAGGDSGGAKFKLGNTVGVFFAFANKNGGVGKFQ